MKKIIFYLLVLITTTFFAQVESIDVKIEKGKVFKDKGIWDIKNVLEANDGSFFTIRSKTTMLFAVKTTYLFNKFDENYNRILSYEYKQEKNYILATTAVTENSFYFVEYKKDKKNKKIIVYINVSPLDTFKFEKREIFSLDIDKFPGLFSTLFSGNSMDINLNGNLSFSSNGDFCVFNIDSYNKKNEKHSIIVLDRDLNELWRKDFKLDLLDNRFNLKNIEISNNGEVFVLGKAYPNGKRVKKKDKRNYHYQLFKITKETSKNVRLSIDDYFVGSLNLTFTNNDKLGCLGFYSDKSDYRYKGICSFFVNPKNLELESKNFSPFTSQFLNDKYGEKKKKELRNINLRDVHYAEDGKITYTAEEYYSTVSTIYINGVITTYYTYHFDDIVIVNADEKGKLNWARNINKAQSSGNYYDPLLSFSSIINREGEVFLFLNAHKNMGKLSGDRVVFRQGWLSGITKKNSNMYVVKFNTKGDFNFTFIQENKKAETIINSRFMKVLDEDKVVFYGSYKNEKQFITVTF